MFERMISHSMIVPVFMEINYISFVLVFHVLHFHDNKLSSEINIQPFLSEFLLRKSVSFPDNV